MSRKILIFYPNNPFTKKHGVHARFLQLMKYFKSRDFIIDMLTHNNRMDNWPDSFDISKLPYNILRRVVINDFNKSRNFGLNILQKASKKIFSKKTVVSDFPDYAYLPLRNDFKKMFENENYDIVLISLIQWANLADDIPLNSSALKILTIEDFFTSNLYEWTHGKINIGECLNEEIKRINKFDKIICISDDEKKFYERFCRNRKFYHIPHSLSKNNMNPSSTKSNDILFVASNNPFNKEGAKWFFDNVYPLLDKQYSIIIIGNIAQHLNEYRNLQNVSFIEFVEYLDYYYDCSKIAICPLLAGSGLKIKIIEALSFGLPVISTKWGLTGINANSNDGIFEANDSSSFAKKMHLLLNDNTLYSHYSKAALNFFLNNFEEEKVFKNLDSIFNL